MLPSLALAFIVGLLLGSQISYFPLSISFVLFILALLGVGLERFALLPVRQVTWCYGLLLIGVVYWTIIAGSAVRDPSPTPVDETIVDLSGRIDAPVQQSPDRFLIIVKLDEVNFESWSSNRVGLTWRSTERQGFPCVWIVVRPRHSPPIRSHISTGYVCLWYI